MLQPSSARGSKTAVRLSFQEWNPSKFSMQTVQFTVLKAQCLLQVFFPFTLWFLSICLLRNLVAAVDSLLLLHIQCSHISLTLTLNYVSNCISFNTFLPICTGQWSLLFLMINYDITICLKSNQKSLARHSPWWSPLLVVSFSSEFYFPPLYSGL